MHQDLRTDDLSDLHGEVCIVGAGAAGITAARRLLALGRQVLLIESGGTDYEEDIADLNGGRSVGQSYYELEHSRLRLFGGTAAIWGGRVAELDPIDFAVRSWVPWSGWPLSHDDLRPHYRNAWRLLGLAYPARSGGLGRNVRVPDFDGNHLSVRYWGFDADAARFTFDACSDLHSHPNCLILTHATVCEILTSPDGEFVEEIVVRAHRGRDIRIRARAFLLAAGGIENARLLLASNRQAPNGLGNGHDLVGRFFMEHPHARGGRVITAATWNLLKAFGRSHMVDGRRVAALIAVAEREQERLGILNSSLTVAPRQPENARQFTAMRVYNKVKHDLAPTRVARTAWRRAKSMATSAQMIADPLRPWILHRMGILEVALLVRAEQSPNPNSRVTLSGERDGLGMQRVELDWRLTDLDKRSVVGLVEAFAGECERLGLGRVEPARWLEDPQQPWRTDSLISAHPIGGYHHMGTTRMASDAKRGVTDAFGKVFGVHNLYIAGSSLFPTSGWANPTLTLMALALRTSEKISATLTKPMARAVPQRREASNR